MTMHPLPRPTIPAAAAAAAGALQLDHSCAQGPSLFLRLAQHEVLQQDRGGRGGTAPPSFAERLAQPARRAAADDAAAEAVRQALEEMLT
jgi:hypothetical protein